MRRGLDGVKFCMEGVEMRLGREIEGFNGKKNDM